MTLKDFSDIEAIQSRGWGLVSTVVYINISTIHALHRSRPTATVENLDPISVGMTCCGICVAHIQLRKHMLDHSDISAPIRHYQPMHTPHSSRSRSPTVQLDPKFVVMMCWICAGHMC